MNLGNVVRFWARWNPDGDAVVFGDTTVTWGQLHDRTSQVANGLAALGVGRGDRVGILSGNCLEYLELAIAGYKLGSILVPLNVRLTPPELALHHRPRRLPGRGRRRRTRPTSALGWRSTAARPARSTASASPPASASPSTSCAAASPAIPTPVVPDDPSPTSATRAARPAPPRARCSATATCWP